MILDPVDVIPAPSGGVVDELAELCERRGLGSLAARLADLGGWIEAELEGVEADLARLPEGPSTVGRSAHHLLALDGKHLRPICVVLAAKLGNGFSPAARQLAVAVELIHNATLLHDDVIDDGERRRGAPTARVLFGNAASIYAGDWLLIEALKRIRRAGIDGVLDRALDTIDEMIAAEALQLDSRGVVEPRRDDYFRIADGKTAALFRLALWAGARAGGLALDRQEALEAYGSDLGTAFQLLDDLLDLDGDPDVTGKVLFADLREGRMSYPLLLALERDAELRAPVEAALANGEGDVPRATLVRIRRALVATEALVDCRALAAQLARQAISKLDSFPQCDGAAALSTVAEAALYRTR